MNPIYRHILTIGTDDYVVHPVYKDDMALDYALESQQLFYRAELSGKMDFVGEDASLIIGQPFTTEYVLTIQSSKDFGLTWSDFHVSKFYQTDCTISLDDLKVTVKPAVKDRYQKVLDGLEKEYNLIELLPVIEPIKLTRRGFLQVYGSGDNIATNIYCGISWEQDFDPQGANLVENLHFAKIANRVTMTFINPPAGLDGVFTGTQERNGKFRLDNGLGVYYIERDYFEGWKTYIKEVSDGAPIWENAGDTGYSLDFYNVDDQTQHIYSNGSSTDIYCRLICDVPQITRGGNTQNTYWIGSNDPMYGGNYHYCIGYVTDSLKQSNRTSTTPTQWGKKNDNEYYNTPSDIDYYSYMPVAQSLWGEYSFWFLEDTADKQLEAAARKQYTLKDAYPLWSVIQVLLTKNETGVTFADTSDYSHFFYDATNPLTPDVSEHLEPYITPKSNILKGEYKDPAMKAPITLAMVFQMLKKAFGCYWWVDEQMRLHVEHISYFKNGGTYTGTHQIGVDITTLLQPTNKKPWSFGTNSYQYDKQDMPARYQYSWMDDCTFVFEGKPVNVVSDFVKTDKVEDVNISNFSADIDYMTIAPENISKDGFVLMVALTDGQTGEKYVPIIRTSVSFRSVDVQNWYASLGFLIFSFLVSDMPSWKYMYGDNPLPYTSRGIQRGKKQTVQIPLGETIPDMMKLVRTGLGDGQIEKMSINLSSRVAKTTLKYDTYDEPE